MITCQNCSTDNRIEAMYCKTCGRKIGGEEIGRKEALSSLDDTVWNCIYCGRFNQDTMTCDGCGVGIKRSIIPTVAEPTTQAPKQNGFGIGCYVSGCNEAVVGQCMVYEDSCGAFYCTIHNKDKLCLNCTELKLEDEIIEDYIQTSEILFKRFGKPFLLGLPFSAYFEQPHLYFTLLSWSFLGLAVISICGIFQNPSIRLPLILIGFFGSVFFGVLIRINDKKVEKEKVIYYEIRKRGFAKFCDYYKSLKQKERFDKGVALASTVLIGFAKGAANETMKDYKRGRDEEKIRRIAREEIG